MSKMLEDRCLRPLELQRPLRTKNSSPGTSLAVQWLMLRRFQCRGTGSIPGQGTKIPHASAAKNNNNKKKSSPSTPPPAPFYRWENWTQRERQWASCPPSALPLPKAQSESHPALAKNARHPDLPPGARPNTMLSGDRHALTGAQDLQ